MKENNNRNILIVLVLALTIGMVGVTIAYFMSNQTITSIFQTKPYSAEFTDAFTSPSAWLPGDTTQKSVTATNTGDVDAAVRVSYEEVWTSQNGDVLEGIQNGNKAAIINLANEGDWTYENGYYYYNHILKKGETTNSFIESITFNPLIESDYTCTNEGEKQICSSTGNGYDGATYKLEITIETIQSDVYASSWNTSVVIK